ncbi:MAG: 3-mercaptopyruvate sulfurtransferase [Rhodospirillales bacterium]|nr:3-mercaptopyruvate sulfurtransferase [Rhodospirillales bacterium]
MDYAHPEALIETDWLAEHLEDPEIRILDASFFLPAMGRDAEIEFELRHIPGARRFDVNAVADTATDLPHMLPDADFFAKTVGGMGIGNNTRVVVYDALGGFMAAMRAWWMFRVFGHDNVAVLNGGLVKWMNEERPVNKGFPPPHATQPYKAAFNKSLVRSLEEMKNNLDHKTEQVIDARSAGRFRGDDDEPRPTKFKGHIPDSINLPFNDLLQPKKAFVMQPAKELKATFGYVGIDLDKPIAATCGSGVTACVTAFGLYLIGKEDVSVYDGSWAEWGNRDDVPIA